MFITDSRTYYNDVLKLRLSHKYKSLFQTTLTMTQDKAFRRISELKEQIKLDMMAKRDLEENYRLMLEEKDEHIKVFQMQVYNLDHSKKIKIRS